jgi:hypothetical protein
MVLASTALLLLQLASPALPDGAAVIRSAHARYEGKWFTTMTFVQKTTFPGRGLQTWYEAMQLPGTLRIDIAPASRGQGMIFRNDSLYRFAGGKAQPGQPLKHSMLILLHDIHVVSPEATIANLSGLGFDLSKTHETTWQGVPVIVVGAEPGDTTSKQFWFEKERLLLVRLIEPNGGGGMDAHFGDYTRHGTAWIEGTIKVHQGGTLVQLEEYTDIRTGVQHESGLFDPSHLGTPTWIGDGAERWQAAPPASP